MAKKLFKNRTTKNDTEEYSIPSYLKGLDLDDDREKRKKKKKDIYQESNAADLDVLDELINGSYYNKKSYEKKIKKDKKKDKKDKKKKDKKSKNKAKGLLDLDEVVDSDLNQYGQFKKKVEKESDEFYESRFNGSLILLREILKQVNDQITTTDISLDDLKNSRARGSQTAMTAQTSNMASFLGLKLNIIKEITGVNKTVSDFELKRLKELGGADAGGANEDYMMNEILKKVMNDDNIGTGDVKPKKKKKKDKKEEKKEKKSKKDLDEAEFVNDIISGETEYSDLIDDDDELSFGYDEEDDDFEVDNDEIDELLDDRIDELIEDGELEFSETEMAFKYEGDARIVIVKNPQNERWRFAALDDEDEEIVDYPLPTKKAVGRVTFDREKGIAKDSLGKIYEIFFVDTNSDLYV